MTTILMYDSVDVSTVPNNPEAVAGYVGGSWPTFSLLVQKFPHAKHKSIAVNAGEDADILDIENGDAVPSEAPAWVRRQQARGLKLPGLYANASEMPSVVAALNAAGIPRDQYVLWVAHYTNIRPNPPFEQGADAVQYTSSSLGRNLDASACDPHFFDVSPPVVNTIHYERFIAQGFKLFGINLSERAVVKQYDKLRATQTPTQHPHRVQLAVLRLRLRQLANRVAREAKNQRIKGKASWGLYYRGWRFQQLIHRAQGQRFV